MNIPVFYLVIIAMEKYNSKIYRTNTKKNKIGKEESESSMNAN